MLKGLKKIEGGIVRDPMFVVCCVNNNNTFELWSDLTIKQGIVGDLGGRGAGSSSSKPNLFLYLNTFKGRQMFKVGWNTSWSHGNCIGRGVYNFVISLNPSLNRLLLGRYALCPPFPSPAVCGRVFAWCFITLPTVTEYPWPNPVGADGEQCDGNTARHFCALARRRS